MKKIFIVVIAVMLCCVTLIPASALEVDGKEFDLPNWDKTEYPYYFIYKSTIPTVKYTLIISKTDFDVREIDSKTFVYYTGEELHWKLNSSTEFTKISLDVAERVNLTNSPCVYANTNLKYEDGTIFYESNVINTECDGSTCPATDSNYDNVCDDCGMPLTMSLRNTLYDYALWLAESKVTDGYNYYAIFKSSDTYYVHISKAPMSSPDGKALEGEGIMYNRVTQSSDGTNGGSGWYNGFYNSYDEFVEANHTISNFKGALPLAVKILGVAGEQITLKLPSLVGVMMSLTLCGVGCLALVIVLSLFGKRSLISRK